MKQDYTIAAVVRALKILRLFDVNHRVMSLTVISSLSGLTKSSALRILDSLESEGFVRRGEEDKKYRLGTEIFIIGNTGYEFSSLRDLAGPLLKKIANATGLTGHLGVLEHSKILFASCVYPDSVYEGYSIASSVGAELPCHCTGVGKVLLAFCNTAQRETLLDKCDFKRYTPNTIVTKQALLTELEQIRGDGYGLNHEEHELYVSCITYPVFDFRRQIVAAVSLTGQTQIMKNKDQEFLHATLKEMASELGRLCV